MGYGSGGSKSSGGLGVVGLWGGGLGWWGQVVIGV